MATPPTVEQATPLAVRVSQATRLTGLSRATLYRRMGDGTLASTRVGGCRLVPMAALQAMAAPKAEAV